MLKEFVKTNLFIDEKLCGDEKMEQNKKAPTAASQLDPQERLKTAAIDMASNIKLHATGTGGENGTSVTANIEFVKKITED